ncbi:hypothetical protein BGZ96_005481 [Linnemannia gamsii]|uniref:Uncharacterized protein n=1 Tax=Linnemannia gamsii TaxID=64522 RepID=A0ABQ7K595_9FUNG|nr:hypothetical protein BGZ96_005481 [Linnemannia gamsii]
MYDSLTALVYCMDYSGPEDNVWREISTLFSNTAIWPTTRFTFKLPNCGPLVGATAVRMVAQGWGGTFYEEDACIFEVQSSIMPPDPVTTTPTPNSNKMPQPTTTIDPFTLLTNTMPPPKTNTLIPPIVPTSRPTEGVTMSDVIIPPSMSTTGPSLKVDPGTQTSTSGGSSGGTGGLGTAFSPPVVTHPPLPPLPTFPNGGGVSPPGGPTVEKNDNSLALKATLLSVGVFAGVAAVVVPLLVMRRRRMRRSRQGSRSEDLLSGGAAPGSGGAGSGVMKETKRRRLGNKSKEGHFYKMEDDDDDDEFDQMQQSSGDLEKRYAAASAATASAAAAASNNGGTETRDKSMLAVGAGVGQLDAVTVPQMALHGDTTAALYHKRRSSLPYMVTSHYTMSSIGDGSSIEDDDSSVVRKYWAASMAARVERRLEGHSPTRGLDSEDDVYGYDEGSIFGDQSRDSDSRMADILSLRTTGSMNGTAGGTMDTTRHHLYEQYRQQQQYRRDTLNTSFGDGISTRTMTPSLSSAQDSCPFSEEEFLERVQFEELQAQLQHEYYAQQQREQRYTHSMISRRTSSVPSLTSTNDPFKTFDSNEIVLDQDQDQDHDPFADDPFSDSRRCTPSPSPSLSLRVPSMSDRSNSDLVGSFPTTPTSP